MSSCGPSTAVDPRRRDRFISARVAVMLLQAIPSGLGLARLAWAGHAAGSGLWVATRGLSTAPSSELRDAVAAMVPQEQVGKRSAVLRAATWVATPRMMRGAESRLAVAGGVGRGGA
eukprot:365900-Chlamydomonas_euryale.AAC.18